jgi:hypothetical protein
MLLSTMTSGLSLRQLPDIIQRLIHEQEPLGGQVFSMYGLPYRFKKLYVMPRPLVHRQSGQWSFLPFLWTT